MENEDYQQVVARLNTTTAEFMNLHTGRVRDIRLYLNRITDDIDTLENTEVIFDAFRPGNVAYRDNFVITGTYLNNRNEKVFSIFQKVYQTNPDREYHLEMRVYETELFGFFNEDTSGSRFYLQNDRYIMSMNNRTEFGSMLFRSRDDISHYPIASDSEMQAETIVVAAGNSGFDVIIEPTPEHLDRGYRMMLVQLVPVIVILLFFSFLFATLISRSFSNRHKILQGKIADLSNWKLDEVLKVEGKDEFGILADELDNTRERILDLITQNYDINELKRVAEMSALRAQINSHFLFNSLSSIKWLSKQGDPEVLSDAVDKLVIFLRYSLALDENQVPLNKELSQLEAYLYLQKLRYGDEININVDVDHELLELKTVKLILQPLVENSISHGRHENGNNLIIKIYSFFDDSTYELIVEDDGIGMSESTIQTIYSGDEIISKSGCGLRNVIERVKMCSNGMGYVIIESQEGAGTKITIKQQK